MSSLKPTVVSIASTIQTILNKSDDDDHYITKRETNTTTDDSDAAIVEELKAMSSDENSPSTTNDKVDGIKYSCPTVANLKMSGNPDVLDRAEVLQYFPEVSDTEPFERTRKDCKSCGAKDTTTYPCPKCGYIHSAYNYPDHSQFYELTDGMPVAYTPGQLASSTSVRSADSQVQKLRSVYDRLGHRYVENPETGNLRLMSPKSMDGYEYQQPPPPLPRRPQQNPYNELHNILDNYQQFLHDVNSHSEGTGLTDSPVNIILDAIKYMRDATLGEENDLKLNNYARSATTNDANDYEISDLNAYETNLKFHPNDMMYSPSDMTTLSSPAKSNGPVKRSFKFTPISQDETDGSVLVRISPTKATQEKLKQYGMIPMRSSSSSASYNKPSSAMMFDESILSSAIKQQQRNSATKTNNNNNGRSFKKISRNGKEYEFLTLDDDDYSNKYNENISEEYFDDFNYTDDDNADLLKYIYRAQQATSSSDQRRSSDKSRLTANLNDDDNFTIEDYDV